MNALGDLIFDDDPTLDNDESPLLMVWDELVARNTQTTKIMFLVSPVDGKSPLWASANFAKAMAICWPIKLAIGEGLLLRKQKLVKRSKNDDEDDLESTSKKTTDKEKEKANAKEEYLAKIEAFDKSPATTLKVAP
jgi:hypothetical protein